MSHPFMVYLETHVVDYCNLNCKSCSHFSPLAPHEGFNSPAVFEKSLKRLSKLKIIIGTIRVMGGEPLIEPEITKDYLKVARRRSPLSKIHLVTNGLLILDMDESFFKVLADKSIIVDITSYPPTLKKREAIVEILEECGIDYNFSNSPVESFTKILSTQNNENYRNEYRNCFNQNCIFLKNNRLFKCPTAAMIPLFVSKFGCNIKYGFGIEINKIKDGWKCLEELDGPDLLCKYCIPSKREMIPWSTTSEPAMEDWIVKK